MPLQIDPGARALIFDIDGTLADTMPTHYEAWRDVLAAHGFALTEELFYGELGGRPSEAIVRLLNARFDLALDPGPVSQEKDRTYLAHADSARAIEPVADLARRAHRRLPLGLATGERRAISERVIRATGLAHLFDAYVTADDVTQHKPHPETFLRCAGLLGVAPSYCQVFEDSSSGMEAARAAGMMVTDVTVFV